MTKTERTLSDKLRALIPGLEFSRKTHVDWADHIEKHPEYLLRHPDFGDVKHHKDCIAEYDERIEIIKQAADALDARTPDGQAEEALLPIIAGMKAIVDREKDASGHVSRKSVAKYFQSFVTKLEHLPRTPEGQEMYAMEHQGDGHMILAHWREGYVHEQVDSCNNDSQAEVFKVVHVIVTKKED